MKILYISVFLLGVNNICQSQDYTIQHFQSSYDTITDYQSVTKELVSEGELWWYWERAFNFGFEFPFYGDTFSEVFIDDWAVGYFPESSEYNVYLFGANYIVADILDTTNWNTVYLNSEVRYAYTSVNDIKALVIEYHNVYERDEYEEYGANHVINFQLWFYENGVIETHFGPIDLDNCSRYLPGEGFTHDPKDLESGIYGPWVAINNFDFSKSAYFFGDHANPNILYDDHENAGVVTSIPPTGFVIQFLPAAVSSTADIQQEVSNNFDVLQHDGIITITDPSGCFESCELYNVLGNKIGYSNSLEFNINETLPQIIFIQIKSDCGLEIHKIWIGQ